LYDVIETDKYIGIVIEYASGGELFDHILAHRYLKERDAAKLFSQLVSGVWYIHQKKIVHRDLKLENLLLDRHRNVIITDFGFANRFEHRSDDLMQTSCGSPCYAAPELVISEGLYVGSAVDIWSCGVILYAMLAGYLPFDDDPANPDGDNINLLYKYIVNTPLSFPDYISNDARDLLSMMLVPDPAHRSNLASIMAHPWLTLHAPLFQRTVEELEQAAKEQMEAKRQAYQKQIQAAAAQQQQQQQQQQPLGRSNSRSRGQDGTKVRGAGGHHHPEYLYETSAEQVQQRRAGTLLDDDPFAPPMAATSSMPADDGKRNRDEGGRKVSASGTSAGAVPSPTKGGDKKGAGGFRHTIQVEYDNHPPEDEQQMPSSGLAPPRRASSKRKDQQTPDGGDVRLANVPPPDSSAAPAVSASPTRERSKTKRRPSAASAAKPLPPPPSSPGAPAASNELPMSETNTLVGSAGLRVGEVPSANGSMDSQSSKRSKHRKGLSMDRIGLGKIFGVASPSSSAQPQPDPSQPINGDGAGEEPQPAPPPPLSGGSVKQKRPSTLQLLSGRLTPKASDASNKNSFLLGGGGDRGSRRNTLTSMMTKRGKASRQAALDNTTTPSKEKIEAEREKSETTEPTLHPPPTPSPQTESPLMKDGDTPLMSSSNNASNSDFRIGRGISASTNKARKVMQWFRSASRGGGRDGDLPPDLATVPVDPILPLSSPDGIERGTTPTQANFVLPPVPLAAAESSAVPPVRVSITPPERSTTPTPGRAESLASRMRRSVGLPPPTVKGVLRIHHGAMDKRAITTKLPAEVMKHMGDVLIELGIYISPESEFKFRCVRPKRMLGIMRGLGGPPPGPGAPMALNMMGSAASNGVGICCYYFFFDFYVWLLCYRWTSEGFLFHLIPRLAEWVGGCSKDC
jgi:protein-serine/threonine kinase